jgi:hypothetical protein
VCLVLLISAGLCVRTSVIRLNPAIRGRVKSGHRERQKT